MTNQISLKLAAVLVALMVNGLIMGGVAYLFDNAATMHTYSSLTDGSSASTHVA